MLEGGIATSSVLFEKYQVTDIVYESDSVTVYSAEHLFMSAGRIIKKILKKSVCRENFYSEINILKSIRHPNIPIVYDVEEDNSAYYIIEERMAGVTLDTFVKERGVLPEEEVAEIGMKLCDIISFLHHKKPVPILFLDVHPKNILIDIDNDKNKISLVDFGSSYYSDCTEKRRLLMGAVGYAAPEQYEQGSLDERTDIYGIGAVLKFLAGDDKSEQLMMIISRCMALDRNDRFESVNALARNLEKINIHEHINHENIHVDSGKPRVISFAGADRRVGVTHISMAFASYLSGQGCSVLYEEVNNSNHLRAIADRYRLKYGNGLFRQGKLLLKPRYGVQINLEVDCDYIVRDLGLYSEEDCRDTETLVLVAGTKPWELEASASVCRRAVKEGEIFILCNGGSRQDNMALWKQTDCMVKQTPVLNDVFEQNDIQRKFFKELADMLGIRIGGGEVYKKQNRLFGKIAEKAKDIYRRCFRRS